MDLSGSRSDGKKVREEEEDNALSEDNKSEGGDERKIHIFRNEKSRYVLENLNKLNYDAERWGKSSF